jgi:predicted RNA binding protein YcfA (HicA-like mRNA interferase family)
MPQITARELLAFLLAQDFGVRTQAGSHVHLVHPDGRRATVPMHSGDLGRGLAATILKDAGFSVDSFIRLR